MQDKGDPLTTTFYHRAIRTDIGRALRAQFDLSQPIPNQLFALLMQLNESRDGTESAEGDMENGTKQA